MSTTAIFFPFSLFGSPGTAAGAELLADAFREMLADNRREQVPTRATAYQDQVRTRELPCERLNDLQNWRQRARQAVRRVLANGQFLLWITGNHLGVLPVYDELATQEQDTLILQFDAHLDIYNLTDCKEELSHGNFLLHCKSPLPAVVNIGHRELLLRPGYIQNYYHACYSAADLAIKPARIIRQIRKRSQSAKQVFLDIDCDVLDPAFFPAVSDPLPFGINPPLMLQLLDAVWSERIIGVSLSEFDPARDANDRSLATLVWLLEFILLKRYEGQQARED